MQTKANKQVVNMFKNLDFHNSDFITFAKLSPSQFQHILGSD